MWVVLCASDKYQWFTVCNIALPLGGCSSMQVDFVVGLSNDENVERQLTSKRLEPRCTLEFAWDIVWDAHAFSAPSQRCARDGRADVQTRCIFRAVF